MLRRRPDNTFEFRDIERALYSIQPPALTPERKDALRARILFSLGEQDVLQQAGILTPVFRERWIAVPAGVGLAVAIIAGIKGYEVYGPGTGSDGSVATFAGELSLDGQPIDEVRPGPTFVAAVSTNVHLGNEVVLMLRPGASFSYRVSDGAVTIFPGAGLATVVTGDRPTHVAGSDWSVKLGAASAADFAVSASAVTVTAKDGIVSLTDRSGAHFALTIDKPHTINLGGGTEPEVTPPSEPFNSNGTSGGNGHSPVRENESDDSGDEEPTPAPGNSGNVPDRPPVVAPEAPQTDQPSAPAGPSTPADTQEDGVAPPVPESQPPLVPPGQGGETPADPPGGGGPEDIPGGEPPAAPPSGSGGPPQAPGSNGNGNGPGSNNGIGNGASNGVGPGSANAGGNGNGSPNVQLVESQSTAPEEGAGGGAGGGAAAEPSAAPPVREGGVAAAASAGNSHAVGLEHAPGQADQSGPANARAHSAQGNSGSAETNPGQGNGPAKKN